MITIRKHERSDIKYRVKWLNNPKVNKFIGDCTGKKTTTKLQEAWFAAYEKAQDKKFFTICDDEKPIGWMGLSHIHKHNKNADLFIAIGEDAYRGKGNGKQALLWLIDFAFNKLHLHKINLGVMEKNVPALMLYMAVGFEVEGRMKDEVFSQGTYLHFLSMAKFNKEKI